MAQHRAAWQSARDALTAHGDRAELAAVLSRFDQVAEAEAARSGARNELAGLRVELAEAEREVERSAVDLEAAGNRVSALRRSADASIWRAELVTGEACPVCLQPVSEIPDHPHHDELAGAERALAEARSGHSAATAVAAKLDRFRRWNPPSSV